MNNSFERALPENYKQAKHINAKTVKFGLIFNIIALVIWILITAIALIPLIVNGFFENIVLDLEFSFKFLFFCAIFLVGTIIYMVLHELSHGVLYKAMTKERLTYGINWSCIYCGMPQLYIYRKTALVITVTPLVLYSIIFGAIAVILYSVSPFVYLLFASFFGLHIGSNAGNFYIIFLLLFKFRNKKMLIRDTGPEQFFYIPVE